jgi:hypothetical protein
VAAVATTLVFYLTLLLVYCANADHGYESLLTTVRDGDYEDVRDIGF